MKKYAGILLILSILVCLFYVQQSYAKYISSASQEANMSIARWKILVNNEDIRNNNVISSNIEPVFLGNDNIAADIIAPTSEGYFDLVIDAREADVSFKYRLDIEVAEDSSVADLIPVRYKIDSDSEVPFPANENFIEKTVLHRDNTSVINVRVYIKWDDGINSTMDNSEDTAATSSTGTPKLNITMTFTQVV